MQKSKNLKRLLVVANILIVICLAMVLILKTKFTYSLYWTLIPFLIVLIVAFIREVDKGRIDTDIDKSKMIKRSYNDISTLSTVFYAMIYLIIMFFDTLNENLRNNVYLIIGFFIVTMLYELFIYLSIYNAKKETRDELNKKK